MNNLKICFRENNFAMRDKQTLTLYNHKSDIKAYEKLLDGQMNVNGCSYDKCLYCTIVLLVVLSW